MSILYNRIPNTELKKRMFLNTTQRITLSFYKYFTISNTKKVRDILYKSFRKFNIFGRVYIANEGINAQISVPKNEVENLQKFIYDFDPGLNNLRFNIASDDNGKSFWVLRIKVRERIVADGINNPTFNPKDVGEYLKAKEVNIMLDDPSVIFVDIRNYYEYEIGHFENALQIPAKTFREQLQKIIKIMQKYKNTKIVMYCTNGIRCEKASAWMKYNGFSKIWHIEGGIIGYVRYAFEQKFPMRFVGKIFVFDERMAERVSDHVIAHCYQCGTLCDTHVNCKNNTCNLLFIQCANCAERSYGYCSDICRSKHEFLRKTRIIKFERRISMSK